MTTTSNIYFPTNEFEKIYLNNIWSISEEDFVERKETILPKGTVELIFNFSDEIHFKNCTNQSKRQLPYVFINGINFKPIELFKTGKQRFIGIQLSSIGLRLLFNISAKELQNSVCFGTELCPQLEQLTNELYFENNFQNQVQMILTWIQTKININCLQKSIYRAQKLIHFNNNDEVTVKKLSLEIGLSDRQLRRFSQDWLGMNTEEFIRYNKYLNSLNLLHFSSKNLTEIGLNVGYYDQSHFIHEFKSFTNLTPKEYRLANTQYPGHIF